MQKLNHTRAVLRLGAVLFLLVTPAGLEAQETQDTMKLAVPLRAARATLQAGYTAFDPAKVNVLFADDAVVMFQGETHSGRAAVDTWIENSMQGLSAIKFGTATFTVADTEVVDRNTYTVTLGDGTQQDGSSELTWRRQADGSWKIARLIVS